MTSLARRFRRERHWALGVGVLVLTGCAPKVKLDQPKLEPRASFAGTATPMLDGPVAIREGVWPNLDWWKVLEDPQLAALITEALRQNNNLTVAAQQIEVARALAMQSRASLFPQATLAPAVNWARVSNNAPVVPASRGLLTDSYVLPVTLSYEFDFWDKNKLALQSAQALAAASEQDWRTFYIEIVSGVATTYFNIATTLAEIRVAEETLQSFREYRRVVQRRYDVGIASELDLQSVKAQISTTEATIPALRLRTEELQHSLAVLLGRNPGDAVDVRALETTRVPVELPGGVPSGLLQRRPDIRAQQDRVRAAGARVGVARALYFPDFTIDLAVGAASISTGSLFLPGSFAMDLLAAAAVPLFRGGALEANLNANIAGYKQEVAAYQQIVLVAFQETQDAVAQVQELTRQGDRLRQAVVEEERLLALVNRSYDAGLSSYLEVLDAERNLLAARNSLVDVEGRRLIAMVSLYKSLGGGWQ